MSIPRPVELNSRQESEFTALTGSRQIGYEKGFLVFLEGVKVIFDTLKSVPNLIKTVVELPKLERSHPGRKTGILIKKSLPQYHIPTPRLHFVETISISLSLTNEDPFTVTSLYIPPDIDPTFYALDLETLTQLGPNPIICGEFNIQHQNC
ncbi:hypothetical protein AVEN_220353-1 [Araneus ventricosus]|uniref:Endonuclease/exonuclease/phosphatase domain-containing protein n=1 Tax=Araneus ventricosus TaxID=182803 RepID=A0A4Y2LUX3_ARAVE|nr:hypothetical protein AVEN_220353-1 [Araneus ventricosus]